MAAANDGPADEAGLIAADPDTGQGGDLIVAVDGTTVTVPVDG